MEEQAFFLVIQSQHQRQLYRQYASRIVCVDSTYGTNAHDYKLITMIICDDWGQGERFTRLSSYAVNDTIKPLHGALVVVRPAFVLQSFSRLSVEPLLTRP